MKRQFLLTAIFLSVLCALSLQGAYAQGKPRLAILPFTGGTGGDGETIAELFSFEPEIDQVFTRIPRTSSIEAIMREQQFQRSTGLTDADTIARLGKQYNADYVVAGHIQTLGASSLVLITIIHVESLQQVAGDYKEYKTIEEVQGMIPSMARIIAQASRRNRAELPKLAVLPFAIPASGVNQNDAEVLAQLIATEMANSGRYAVLPRTSMIETVMREHQIQRSNLTEENNIKRIGQALNAQYVLAGNVRRLGQANMFTAQILNVENANLIVGGYENYNAIGDGLSRMPSLGVKLASVRARGVLPANFVWVEGGTFWMGSDNGDSDERPIHSVTVSDFSISKYEVTQREWQEIMGNNPSSFKGNNLPVESVSWYDAIEYCNRRSEKEGLQPAYRGSGNNITCDWNANGYRLPTEAEWEYAARGGNGSPGNYTYSGSNSIDTVAWYAGNSGKRTQPVGMKAANSLGIYDMSGNVWEWCWDWYGSYSSGSQTDPRGAVSGDRRVKRGGSWDLSAGYLRSAYRGYNGPYSRINYLGFRLVRP